MSGFPDAGLPLERLCEDFSLLKVFEKLLQGHRLTLEDGLKLLETNDILTLGLLADHANREKNGKVVYFIRNRHINLTNICVGTCKFCAFRKKPGEAGAFALTVDRVLEKLSASPPFTEVHMVSALHPEWNYRHYIEFAKEVKRNFPHATLQAFTAEEVEHLCRISGKKAEEVIAELIEAGVDSLPGGGAEILSEELRKKLCPDKLSAQRYLEIHKIAHRFGMKTNASILYGHIETHADRVKHLLALRELQDETGGFQAFISFAYHPLNTELGGNFTTGFDDLKMLATARLMLDNFQHIRTFWITLGEKLAQVSLHYGVNDFDGTVVEESITRSAGAGGGSAMSVERLVELITESGKTPVERDTFYNILRVYNESTVTADL